MSNVYRSPSPRHKSATEYFVDTLRKTGVGEGFYSVIYSFLNSFEWPYYIVIFILRSEVKDYL